MVPLTMPKNWRAVAWRGNFEMGIDDRAIILRRLQARHQALRGIGRNRENDFVCRSELHDIAAEIEGLGAAAGKIDSAQPMVEPDLYPAFNEIIERGIDECGREAVCGDERTAGAPSLGQAFRAPRRRRGGMKLRRARYSRQRGKTAATAARKAIRRSA